MEYGIRGATRTKADYFKMENNSPRMFAISELYLESLLNRSWYYKLFIREC